MSNGKQMALLLAAAARSPVPRPQHKQAVGKLYELKTLAVTLHLFRTRTKGQVKLKGQGVGRGKKPKWLCIAGNPATADRTKFNYFLLSPPHRGQKLEAWISVECNTLSAYHYEWANKRSSSTLNGARHEIDVGLFEPFSGKYPWFQDLACAISCKATAQVPKAFIRELLGVRREMGYLREVRPSRVEWLVREVPAKPAAPVILIASSPSVENFVDPMRQLGVFVARIPR